MSRRHFGAILVVAAISLVVGVLGGIFVGQLTSSEPVAYADAREAERAADETAPLDEVVRIATPKPTFTPQPTPTFARQPVPLQPMGQQVSNPVAPAASDGVATPTPVAPLIFVVTSDEVRLREGPGSAYPPIARARQGAELPATGRTADGLWWQLCCLDGNPVWMELDPQTVRATGDVGGVAVVDVVVYDLEPTPPPPPPPPAAPAIAQQSQPAPRVIAPAPTPRPAATPRPKGNPSCSTGMAYPTIPVIGPARTVPAAQDPEINLALRGYIAYPGFLQKIGMGGHTDPHAPQFGTLFGDRRIPKDFPTVYHVREWDWGCNCPGPTIGYPEVTALGISTSPGEMLYTPTRTQGDIGGGYRAMVLFATPTSITLKYTREDDMLFGYGLHIDGICVSPELLALYYQMDDAGRRSLPVLRAGDPLGRAIGDTVRLAVRDTGQFMDPRSEKDWWVEGNKIDGAR